MAFVSPATPLCTNRYNGSYADFHCVPSDTLVPSGTKRLLRQPSLCPQRHLSTNRYKTALTPTFIVSPATPYVPTGTTALTPTLIVSPATPQVVRRREVQVFFVVSVL